MQRRSSNPFAVLASLPLHEQIQSIEAQARQPPPASNPLVADIHSDPPSEPSSAHSSDSEDSNHCDHSIPPAIPLNPLPNKMNTTTSAPFDHFTNDVDQDVENWMDTFSNWCDIQDGWDDARKCKALLVWLGNEDLKSYYRSLKIAATNTRPFNWTHVKADFIAKYKVNKKKQVLVNSLINLKHDYEQNESVTEYSKRFIALSNKISTDIFPEKMKVRIYVANLDPRINGKMNHLTEDEDTTLTAAEVEAKRIEEQRKEVDEINQKMKKVHIRDNPQLSNNSNMSGYGDRTQSSRYNSNRYGNTNRYNNPRSNNNTGNSSYGNRNHNGNQDVRRSASSNESYRPISVRCYRCGQLGHTVAQCSQAPMSRNESRPASTSSSQLPSAQRSHHAIIASDDATIDMSPIENEDTGKYYVDISINGVDKVNAQVDCGAMVSVISAGYFKTLSYKPIVSPCSMKLHGVDGRPIPQSGMIQVVMGVHGHIIPRPVRLIVINESADDTTVILGNDFARQHTVSTDVIKHTLQLKYSDEIIPITSDTVDDNVSVYSLMKEVIPPQSVVHLRVRLGATRMPEPISEIGETSVIFEPSRVDGVSMPPALVNATGDREALTVTVNNLSNERVTINENTKLGVLAAVQIASAEEVVNQNNLQLGYMDADHEDADEDVHIKPSDAVEIAAGVTIDLSGSVEMKETEKTALVSVLQQHATAFANHPKKVGTTDLVQHRIDTGNTPPIHVPPYRLGPHIDGKIQEMVQDMVADGVIIESASPWSSPVLLVKKKDGSMRFCIDFRRLNAVTKRDVYPLLRIDSTLDALGKASCLSSLDMQSGYWQIALDRRDAEKTAFSTPRGHYEFVVMPFGLTNAPATFQRLMDSILRDFQSFCLVYIDDIIIFSESFEEHLVHLSRVLQRLIDSHLIIKPSKCQFLKQKLGFLGHVITPGYISPDSDKVSAVAAFPTPYNVKSLQSFLGLVNYYRRFIKSLSNIAEPLYGLLKKGTTWQWTDTHQRAYESLKMALTSAPLMRLPNFDLPFILHTDANNTGLGAVLSQIIDNVEHPIYYASKTLNPAQRNYHTTERECLAVKWACQLFRPYLIGKPFVVYTDHAALSWLFKHRDPNSKLTRMILSLQEFTFEVIHRSGAQNGNADALSRIADIREEQINAKSKQTTLSAITRSATNSLVRRPVPRPHSDIYFQEDNYDLDAALAASANIADADNSNNDDKDNSWPEEVSFEGGRNDDNKDNDSDNKQQRKESGDQADEEEKYIGDDTSAVSPIVPSDSEPISLDIPDLQREQRKDPQSIPIMQYLEAGILPVNSNRSNIVKNDAQHYILLEGILHHKWLPTDRDKPQADTADFRPVIPVSLRPAILRSFHDSSIAGHLGEAKTYARIRNRYYWQGMYKDVQYWIKTCQHCSMRKSYPIVSQFPLGQLPTPTAAFQCLGIDVLGPLPITTKGYKYILCITDYYTRYPIAIPMTNQRANTIAKLLVEEVFLVYGFPASILSDRGSNFLSDLLSAVLELFRIRKLSTSAYHPQTNGLTERFNGTLTTMLSHFISQNQNNWDIYLAYVLFAYRTSVQEFHRESPFFCVFGRPPQFPEDIMLRSLADNEMNTTSLPFLAQMQRNLKTAYTTIDEQFEQLELSRSKASSSYSPTFQPGDLVLHYVPVVSQKKTKKLSYLWQGPYMILDIFNGGFNYKVHRVNTNNYQLISNAASKVVNANRLKKYYPSTHSPLRNRYR